MGVLVVLIGFACFIVCLIWLILCAIRKKPKKQAAIGLLVGVVLFIGGAAWLPEDKTETPSERSSTSALAEADEPDAETPELSEAYLSALVSALDGVKPEDISVTLNGGVCEVSYTDTETHWNEGRMIGAEMSAFINFGRDAFALDGLTEVKWLVSIELTDARGNVSIGEAVKIDMTRDAFALYDWDNLNGKRIYEQFSADCLTFWVRSSIANKAKATDVYYSAH